MIEAVRRDSRWNLEAASGFEPACGGNLRLERVYRKARRGAWKPERVYRVGQIRAPEPASLRRIESRHTVKSVGENGVPPMLVDR
jgi:hypothetical protein